MWKSWDEYVISTDIPGNIGPPRKKVGIFDWLYFVTLFIKQVIGDGLKSCWRKGGKTHWCWPQFVITREMCVIGASLKVALKILRLHWHRNVVRMTALILTGNVEAKLQRSQWGTGQSSWRHSRFYLKYHTKLTYISDLFKLRHVSGLPVCCPVVETFPLLDLGSNKVETSKRRFIILFCCR